MNKLAMYVRRVLVVLCALFVFPFPVSSSELGGIITTGNYSIPKDFAWTISDTCSDHDYFIQAAANDQGHFAIVSFYTDIETNPDLVYKLVYIDVYNQYGEFQQELSFYCTQEFVMEYSDETIILYFYDHIISYDMNSQTLEAYTIPAGFAKDNGIYDLLRQSSFEAGEWYYRCKKSFHGYTELSRENDCEKQMLISLPGIGITLWKTLVSVLVLGIGGFWVYKKARKSQ